MTFVIIKKDEQVKRKMADLPRLGPRALKRALYDIGYDMYKEARRLIKEGPKTGILYKIKGKRSHRASAPGEPPANWTGKLRRSVGFNVRKDEVEYGYRLFYGKFLEEGTVKMKERPGLRITYKNKMKNISNHFNYRFREELERKI